MSHTASQEEMLVEGTQVHKIGRRRLWRPAACCVAACVVFSTLPAAANDDIASLSEVERQQLLSMLQKGNMAFDAGQWQDALESYEGSLRLLESASIQYRRGLCLEKLERYGDAVEAYHRFLTLDPSAPESGRVRADITRLEAIVERQSRALVTINTLPAGADVRLDDPSAAILGRTPLLEVRVDPGAHTLHLSKEGYQDLHETIDAQPGKTLVVSYPLAVQVSSDATVAITSTPPGAVVRLGTGRVAGRTPLTLTLPAGAAEFTLEAEGYLPRTERPKLKAGQELSVTVSLERVAEAAKPLGPLPKVSDSRRLGWGWGLTATGVVFGLGSVGFGLLTESTIQEANDYSRQSPRNSRAELSAMERDAQLYRIATWVTGGLGGATLLTGSILLLTTLFDDSPSSAVLLGPTPGGAQMEWIWAF